MIKLERISPPKELTADKVAKFTKQYQEKDTAVWQKSYIKERLLEMSYDKCAYCECELQIAAAYVEIEHFLPKKHFSEKVMEWENLLPSCKRCNGLKHDKIIPIIEPTKIEPKEHLLFNLKTFSSNTDLGKQTIAVLKLNHSRLKKPRNKLRFNIIKDLEMMFSFAEVLENAPDNNKAKSNLYKFLKSWLEEVQPTEEYCAVKTSILFTEKQDNQTTYYQNIKTKMQALDIWKEELTNLENEAKKYVLKK